MREPRRDTRWWGWGDPARSASLDEEAWRLLGERLGERSSTPLSVELEDFELPEAEPLPVALAKAVGEGGVHASPEDRLRHATGAAYVDLVRLRSGRLSAAPDAVLLPESPQAVRRILEICSAEGIAVVPFGGGTSVVGGVEPLRGEHARLVSLDLSGLRDVSVDSRSLTATLGAGLRGPEAEAALARHGLVLGHYPQSFEYATIGGFAASRSAGQASSGYGRFDDLVDSLALIAPAGELRTLQAPHTAAGPSLRELVLGSEGIFGVIPEVTVRVRPQPDVRRFEAWIADDFEAGAEIVRELAQGPGLPAVIRVSDEEETESSLALSGPRGMAARALDAYLGARGKRRGALIVVGIEGDAESVARRRALTVRALRSGGAAYLGRGAGRSWEHGRFEGPYLRETLMDAGVMVETLETAHAWSHLEGLRRAVGRAIADGLATTGAPGFVLCHLSHAYADGASLYFTVIAAARTGEETSQWRTIKGAACEAIVAAGGTITHHHGVGTEHAPYMESEIGRSGLAALRAMKEELDPVGIMNPGKLLARL